MSAAAAGQVYAAVYEPRQRISCGCCTGDGTGCHPGNDRCTCHIHQDVSRGLRAHQCEYHQGAAKAGDLS